MSVSQSKSRIWKAIVSEEISGAEFDDDGKITKLGTGKVYIQYLDKDTGDSSNNSDSDSDSSSTANNANNTSGSSGSSADDTDYTVKTKNETDNEVEITVFNSSVYHYAEDASVYIIQDQYGTNWVQDDGVEIAQFVKVSGLDGSSSTPGCYLVEDDSEYEDGKIVGGRNNLLETNERYGVDLPIGSKFIAFRAISDVGEYYYPSYQCINSYLGECYMIVSVNSLPVYKGEILVDGNSNYRVVQEDVTQAPEYGGIDISDDITRVLVRSYPLFSNMGVKPKISSTSSVNRYGYDSSSRSLSYESGSYIYYDNQTNTAKYEPTFMEIVTLQSDVKKIQYNGNEITLSYTYQLGPLQPDVMPGDTIVVKFDASSAGTVTAHVVWCPIDVPDGTIIYGKCPGRNWTKYSVSDVMASGSSSADVLVPYLNPTTVNLAGDTISSATFISGGTIKRDTTVTDSEGNTTETYYSADLDTITLATPKLDVWFWKKERQYTIS